MVSFLLILGAAAIAADGDNTCFQIQAPYAPEFDVGSDVAIVYGASDGFAPRGAVWRSNGYEVSLMTGIAWGDYGAYYGEGAAFKKDEVQTEKSGRLRMHGNSTNVGYNVPTPEYIEFIKRYIEPAIEFGVHAVYLEEPEYWANTGWSEGFKKEWQRFYGEPWQPPDSSPDAQYRASKLKYELYFNALREVFAHVDARAAALGKPPVECHVPTHSLINYAQWRIVSPESHLIDIPQLDGYIAQVWTGTARSQNAYGGVRKERTFETAYLEYGQMLAMVRPTGKKVWFLHDPVEDNPNRSWNDYRYNYECTVVASLMWPEVHRFEVMPWPGRIFRGEYAAVDMDTATGDRVGIPHDYATEILAVINALNDMKQSDIRYEAGTRSLGVLVSDTMMFQRADPTPSDPMLGSFYGLALPLLKAGVPVNVVQLENVTHPRALEDFALLLLTYEHQKPLKPDYHDALAQWVRGGGSLLLIDDGSDPYHGVREWWNDNGARPAKAYDDLLVKLGANQAVWDAPQPVGKGFVWAIAESPAKLTYAADGPGKVREWVAQLLSKRGDKLETAPFLCVRRGPYIVASVLDESPYDNPRAAFSGTLTSVFDPALTVRGGVTLGPNERALLFDIDYARRQGPAAQVLAGSARVRNERVADGSFTFDARGPLDTTATLRVLLPREPRAVSTTPSVNVKHEWHASSSTALITFPNIAATVQVRVDY